jgi:hypothetical protein
VVVHPDPHVVRERLERLGLDHPVQEGPEAGIRARVATPAGLVELR